MAKRVHPNAYRIGVSKPWNYKYLEKKTIEQPTYDFRILEIKKFIFKFFKDNNINLYECKINYSNNNSVQIFLSYYKLNEIKKILPDLSSKKVLNEETELYNAYDYQLINYSMKSSGQNFEETQKRFFKKKFFKKNSNYKRSIISLTSEFSVETWDDFKLELFFNKFIQSLILFLGHKISIFLTFQELNKSLFKRRSIKFRKFLNRSVGKLNRYRNSAFFKEGLTTLYICSKYSNSANLLAEFIARFIKNIKRPKFFLSFVKKGLTVFKQEKNFSANEIKIKISGRLTKSSRARQKVMKISNKIPILTIKANINYAEKIVFTSNGTVGVKVWIYNKNIKKC